MISLRGHHVKLLLDGIREDFKGLENHMEHAKLGGPSSVVRCYDDLTVQKIVGFYRALAKRTWGVILIGESGRTDSVCRLCGHYNSKEDKCNHPPYPGNAEVEYDDICLRKVGLSNVRKIGIEKLLSKCS